MEGEDLLAPLSWLFGTWETIEAEAAYPTIETVNHTEVLDMQPNREPFDFVDYSSNTYHPVKKTKLHCEKGFLKVHPEEKTGRVTLIMAHHFGLAEVSEGIIEKGKKEIRFESKNLTPSIDAVPHVTKLIREWKLVGDELHTLLYMGTSKTPLQQHIVSRYRKKK